MASLSAKLKSSLGGFYDTLSSPLYPPMVSSALTSTPGGPALEEDGTPWLEEDGTPVYQEDGTV